MIVTAPTPLGMLDLDQPGVSFNGVGPGRIEFDTAGSNAVLLARNIHDTSGESHVLALPVTLNRTTEMTNDGTGPLVLSGAISGTGGVEKNGAGEVVFTSVSNSFLGGINVNAGAGDQRRTPGKQRHGR